MKNGNALLLLLVAVLALGLGGCNTIAGAGQDIESAGGAIEDAAEDAK
ncbi:MAG: entericidin A/B family lipoprotein [Halioglobus sp.]|nr:entericidin A/B family lipoprotein [Halioglobus sp.]